MRRRWCALMLGLAVGCGGPERRADDVRLRDDGLRTHMKQHVARATEARDWIIAGDLERAREPATWLATHESPYDFPQDWMPLETDLRIVAGDLSAAPDLSAAATAVSTMGRSCGACHAARGVELRLASTAPILQEDQAGHIMSQHEWAALRMWEGLYAPSERAWREGADAVRHVLQPDDIMGLVAGSEQIVELESELHAIARRARGAHGATEKAQLYGDLLGTCSSCHTLIAEL